MKKAMASAYSQSVLSKPRHTQEDTRTDRSLVHGRSEHESQEGDSYVTPASRRSLWDPQAGIDNLPLGKRQVMDKFFTPVHRPRHEETKAREPYLYASHHSNLHHHHHQQDDEGHGYGTPGSSNESVSRGHVHHRLDGHRTPEHLDHPPPPDCTHLHGSRHHSRCSDASPHSQPHDHDPVASSPRSCSRNSSSSSWSSEASIDKEAFLTNSRPGPRHSQSCGSLPAEGPGFWDEEEGAHLEGLEGTHPRHHHCRDDCVRKLHRGQSRSEEELPRTNSIEDVRPVHLDHTPLYKSASLGRSLAFNDYTEILLDSEKPKKAPSSIQLPSKGILKNKQGQGGAAGGVRHFRKAKSLEVLSTHVQMTAGGMKGGRGEVGKDKLENADVEKRKEAVRQNFVREKLQFSAFLNEITRQVISPSRLSSLGVPYAFGLPSPGQASQKPPRKEQRAEGERQEGGQAHRQQKDRSSTPDSAVSSGHSHSSKYSHSSKRHHSHQHSIDGHSQQQHHMPGGQTDPGTNSPERCLPPGHGEGSRGEKQHQGGYNLLLTDGTNTSPELSPHVARRHLSHVHPQPDPLPQHQKHHQPHLEKRQRHHARRSPSPHSPCPPKTIQTDHKDTHSGVPGQESDSSQNKDSASTTSTSLELSDKNKQICYKAAAVQDKDTVTDVDRAQALREQNEELRDSLLQTMARMEFMEAELQKTQEELNSFKDSFNKLQESASSTQQSNELLEQKLQTTVLSMDVEQKCLYQRISELSKELVAAQATILSLKTVNTPSLLQELLDKYFQSKEAVTEALLPAIISTQFNDVGLDQAPTPRDDQSPSLVQEREDYGKNWQQVSEGSQHRATTCQPWKREQGHRLRPEGDQKGGGVTVSEVAGGKEAKECLSSLLIPHLQLTPQQTSPSDTLHTPGGGGQIAHQLGSLIDILSGPSGKQQQCRQDLRPDTPSPAALKSTGAPQNLPSPAGGDQKDSDEDEIIYKWRLQNRTGTVGVSRNSLENDASVVTYQSAQRLLDNFMRHLQPAVEREAKGGGRALASGSKEESLNVERGQL